MNEKPFVIYLDIDGVLVSYLKLKDRDSDGKHSFIPASVDTLNSIISMFSADVCIVSTWARGKTPEKLSTFLKSRGIIINNLTIGNIDYRAEYVLQQKELGFDRFLIIDDEAHQYYERVNEIGYNRILASNSWRCLDEYDLVGVSRNFNRLNSTYPHETKNS